MTRLTTLAGFLLSLVVTGSATFAQDLGWPRTTAGPAGKLVLFQPHIDSWDSEVVWRQAFQLTPAGGTITIGAASFQGASSTNTETHIITISGVQVNGTFFPGLNGPAPPSLVALLSSLAPPTFDISLERLVTYMRTPASMRQPRAAAAPVILVSFAPAVLLRLKGPPVLAPVPNTHLKFVANTSWPLFKDSGTGHFYLLANNLWLEARKLDGPWLRATHLPEDFRKLPATGRFAAVRTFVPPPHVRDPVVPEVLHSSSAADLILFEGQPAYAAIEGTRLERATNTRSPLFRFNRQSYYYLAGGRWFSAPGLKGPWTDVTSALPADFSDIPPDSPASAVLAAVPGTSQAEAAALLARVPRVPAPSAAQVSVSYLGGTPQFLPVEGTTMQYASNTRDKVLLIGSVYYLSRRGAWFMAPSPQGPWAVAAGPPEVIYTIPPSSPVYTVTYVSWGYDEFGDYGEYWETTTY